MCFQHLVGGAWTAATQPAMRRAAPATVRSASGAKAEIPDSSIRQVGELIPRRVGFPMAPNQISPSSTLLDMKQPSMAAVARKGQRILKHLVVCDSLSDHISALSFWKFSLPLDSLNTHSSCSLPTFLVVCLLSLLCFPYFSFKYLSLQS